MDARPAAEQRVARRWEVGAHVQILSTPNQTHEHVIHQHQLRAIREAIVTGNFVSVVKSVERSREQMRLPGFIFFPITCCIKYVQGRLRPGRQLSAPSFVYVCVLNSEAMYVIIQWRRQLAIPWSRFSLVFISSGRRCNAHLLDTGWPVKNYKLLVVLTDNEPPGFRPKILVNYRAPQIMLLDSFVVNARPRRCLLRSGGVYE